MTRVADQSGGSARVLPDPAVTRRHAVSRSRGLPGDRGPGGLTAGVRRPAAAGGQGDPEAGGPAEVIGRRTVGAVTAALGVDWHGVLLLIRVARPQIQGPALAVSVLRLAPIVPGHHYPTVEPRLRGSSVGGNGDSVRSWCLPTIPASAQENVLSTPATWPPARSQPERPLHRAASPAPRPAEEPPGPTVVPAARPRASRDRREGCIRRHCARMESGRVLVLPSVTTPGPCQRGQLACPPGCRRRWLRTAGRRGKHGAAAFSAAVRTMALGSLRGQVLRHPSG
jgi:hypothetical protein